MNYFDLHCDTVTKAFAEKISLSDGEMHINLKKAGYIENYEQCFAIWIDDKFKGRSAFSFCCSVLDFYDQHLKNLTEGSTQNFTPILTIENGSALAGDADNIAFFADRGVKMMTLTWNGENELGFGVGAGSSGGLKYFGKRAIKMMEKENITVDVSHLNEQGFRAVVSVTAMPFAASHSGCYSIVPHKRNLKNWQIKEIIASDGLIGIPFCESFIGGGKEKLYEHICHVLSLGGENNIAIGSDFDGCDIHPDLSGIEKVKELYAFLCESDIGKALTDKIFYINAENFFYGKD